ncbi:acyltransferase family protein [Lusitaniella coriacea]|uniref:acyltransferase family protein n=1 Tax=Lusitaniella coriacea TaxID=1983105 RepID=UPI003CE9FE0A
MHNKAPFKRVQLNLLQAFRGIAALLVVLFHVDQLSNENLNQPFLFDFFQFGSAGVDYFLVLSGFVAIYAHWHELGQRSFKKFKSFLTKRFIRIYPVYWIVSIVVIAFLFVMPGFAKKGDLTLEFLGKSFLLFPQSEAPLLDVGWTLILIVFFYLIFSLVFILPLRFYLPLVVLLMLASGTQYIQGLAVTNEYPVLQLLTNSLNPEFALGCLAAWLALTRNLPQRKSIFIAGSTLFLLVGILHAYDVILDIEPLQLFGTTLLLNRVFFFGIPCFLLVLGAASLDLNKGTEIPQSLNYLGNASYSIYLIHSPVVSAMTKLAVKFNLGNSPIQALLIGFLILAIALTLGCLFYSFVEQPIVGFLRQRLIKRKTPAKSAV